MLACSDPPEGAARWTLRLPANKMVELGYVDSISHVTVGEMLKNALKPWRVKSWCIGKLSGSYVAKMEDVLDVYQRPYDPAYPVVCLDEAGKELHDTPRGVLPLFKPIVPAEMRFVNRVLDKGDVQRRQLANRGRSRGHQCRNHRGRKPGCTSGRAVSPDTNANVRLACLTQNKYTGSEQQSCTAVSSGGKSGRACQVVLHLTPLRCASRRR